MKTFSGSARPRLATAVPRSRSLNLQGNQALGAQNLGAGPDPRQILPGINHALSTPWRYTGQQESQQIMAWMKVSGTSGVGQTGPAKPGRAAATDAGFRLPGLGQAAGPAQVARAAGLAGVASVDALLALQEAGGPLERRRRAVGRAGRILDELDKLKTSLLDGTLAFHKLDQLRRAVREERANTDDPRLEAVLEEIETRAAVELAKLERSNHAA